MTINGNTAMAVGALGIVLLLLCIGAWVAALFRIKDIKRSVLYIAESAILIFVVLLLAWGTRDTVLKVVDSFQRDKVVFSDDRDTAVLEAYDKLSNELNRWSVMFVALGAFFGLVLPIGAYLLQMKEIARKEGAVDEKLDEEARLREKSIDDAKREIQGMQNRFSSDISKVWQDQAISAHESLKLVVEELNGGNRKFADVNIREIYVPLILFLKYLENTGNRKFVVKSITNLVKSIRQLDSKIGEDLVRRQNGRKALKSNGRIALSKYFEGNEEGMKLFQEVKGFLLLKIGADIID